MDGTIIWTILVLVWVLAILVVIALLRRRAAQRRAARLAALRPNYFYGNSIADWEKACELSLRWSSKRRKGKEIKG